MREETRDNIRFFVFVILTPLFAFGCAAAWMFSRCVDHPIEPEPAYKVIVDREDVYYVTDFDIGYRNGVIQFRDMKTGKQYTIGGNYRVEEMNKPNNETK